MKLNKNGWGFLEFFIFLVIFAFCLIITAVGLKSVGLINEDWQFVKFSDKKPTKVTTNYMALEEDMINGTKKYIEKFYNNQLGLDTLNIKVSQLIDNDCLEKLEDANGKSCSGYVSVYLNEENTIVYKPYMKCKKYETKGYEERKDD